MGAPLRRSPSCLPALALALSATVGCGGTGAGAAPPAAAMPPSPRATMAPAPGAGAASAAGAPGTTGAVTTGDLAAARSDAAARTTPADATPPPRAGTAPRRTNPPAEPEGAWTEHPLRFVSGDFTLEGTLTLPQRSPGQRVPGVIIVHGSGPMARDGSMPGQLGTRFGFSLPVYAELARTLARTGIASLRWDKRTCGRFNACAENGYPLVPLALRGEEYDLHHIVADAAAAAAALQARPEVDAARCFVVGHSQGGQLTPELLTRVPTLRGGVMLAPPFSAPDALLARQGARLSEDIASGVTPALHEPAARQLTRAGDDLAHLRHGRFLGAFILGQPAAIWASWLGLADRAPTLAAALERPLLVLGGDADTNVEPAELERWRAALGPGPASAPRRVGVFPCVTHALNCVRALGSDGARTVEARLHPPLVAEVAAFVLTPP